MLNCANHPSTQKHLASNPIPLIPFLELKAIRTSDKDLDRRLKAIKKGLVPNYPEWCAKFKTTPPYLADKPDANGRMLFADNEGPTATEEAVEEAKTEVEDDAV